MRRALTRNLAAYLEYLFYHYDFNEVVDRPAGLPQEFSRNGVRVGLNLWLPLISENMIPGKRYTPEVVLDAHLAA